MQNNCYKEYADIFKVLSDSTRLQIFSLLSTSIEICGCEILEKVSITQPTLSYHMKLLCESGLAKGRKDGAWMRYSLNQQTVNQLKHFLALIGT